MTSSRGVLVLARETPGDPAFYSRWQAVGQVFRSRDEVLDPAVIEVLVVDQRVTDVVALVAGLPSLKWVCSATTGHTHLQGVPEHLLVTLQGETLFLEEIHSVSEHVFNLIFRLVRPLDGYGQVLHEKTIGIVGMGRIGNHVRDIACGFGMDVWCHDVYHDHTNLKVLFERSDFITVHLSENDETMGMIDMGLINLMKPTAYLINTARPSLIDRGALLEALNSKAIAGAAEDFLSALPTLQSDHIAGSTIEDRIKTDSFIVAKLQRMMLKRAFESQNVAAVPA